MVKIWQHILLSDTLCCLTFPNAGFAHPLWLGGLCFYSYISIQTNMMTRLHIHPNTYVSLCVPWPFMTILIILWCFSNSHTLILHTHTHTHPTHTLSTQMTSYSTYIQNPSHSHEWYPCGWLYVRRMFCSIEPDGENMTEHIFVWYTLLLDFPRCWLGTSTLAWWHFLPLKK